MSLVINLLGRPAITRNGISGYQFRSRKSWALLAYLILSERAPARVTVATMLFDEADDPLRALRWNLSEIRRALGDDVDLSGDPLTIRLPDDAVVDVVVVARGRWAEAVRLAGLGSDLLETVTVRGAAGFESWLLAEQRRLAASSEAILHEAALGSASRGELSAALGFAVRAATMSPLDENHQALLIRLYRLAGDDRAAERQYEACKETFERELGVQPGPAIVSALRERGSRHRRRPTAHRSTRSSRREPRPSRPAPLRRASPRSGPPFALPTRPTTAGCGSGRAWPWRRPSSTRCVASTRRV